MSSANSKDTADDLYTRKIYDLLRNKRKEDNSKLWGTQVKQLKRDLMIAAEEKQRPEQKEFTYHQCPEHDETENVAKFFISNADETYKVQKLLIERIPSVKTEPTTIYWTNIDSNIRIQERPQFNGQNVDDTELHSDEEESEELKAAIAASTNTNSHSNFAIIQDNLQDDQLFVSLVTYLLIRENTGQDEGLVSGSDPVSTDIAVPNVSMLDLSQSSVFNIIQRVFPCASFPFLLRERYFSLISARHVNEGTTNRITKKTIRNGKLSLSRDEILQPYHKLFCRRCYVYNCLLHGDDEKVEPTNCLSYPSYSRKKKRKPCSSSCYLHSSVMYNESEGTKVLKNTNIHISKAVHSSHSSTDGSFTSHEGERKMKNGKGWYRSDDQKSNSSTSLDEGNCSSSSLSMSDPWTSDEIESYRCLYSIFPNYWCTLAKLIRTKDCNQVYRFSKQQELRGDLHEPIYPQDPKISSLKDVRAAQKHKTVKSWFNHSNKYDLLLSKEPSDRPVHFPLYKPCSHKGLPCEAESSGCICLQNKINCEKFCGCVSEFGNCHNLFPGCRCKGARDGVCDTKRCSCFFAHRECDVDICGCGIMPDEDSDVKSCNNTSIQDRLEKKLYKNVSRVAGYGLFAGEDISKDDFIGEYLGEIISHAESEKRSVVDNSNGHTYLFSKDEEQILDGKMFGNLLRFINSSRTPNTYPLIKNVSGNLRIGLYAQRDIIKDEELFFNYEKVLKQQLESQLSTAKKQPVAVKAASMLPYKPSVPDPLLDEQPNIVDEKAHSSRTSKATEKKGHNSKSLKIDRKPVLGIKPIWTPDWTSTEHSSTDESDY